MIPILNAVSALNLGKRSLIRKARLLIRSTPPPHGDTTRLVLSLAFILIILAVVGLVSVYLYGVMAQAVENQPPINETSPAYEIQQQGINMAKSFSQINNILPSIIILIIIIAVIGLLFAKLRDVFGGGGGF